MSGTSIHYLIDASIYIFQSHFSPNVVCYSNDGSDRSAVYGFTLFLLQFLRRMKPESIAVAMDESLFCGFRHQLCTKYKSNRELPDENLELQLLACKGISSALGLATYGSRVYEADDIVGVLAGKIRDQHQNPEGTQARTSAIHIVTKDKDLAQLLDDQYDCLWDFSSNKRRFMADIQSEFGVTPLQIPDYLGLVGDAVDCIEGIPGLGPVKAKALLSRYANLEDIYLNLNHIAELPVRGAKSLQKSLELYREQAFHCRKLATIVTRPNDHSEAFLTDAYAVLNPLTPNTEAIEEYFNICAYPSAMEGYLRKQITAYGEKFEHS